MRLFISLLFIGALIGLGAMIGKGTPKTPSDSSKATPATESIPTAEASPSGQGGAAPTGTLFSLTKTGQDSEIQRIDVVSQERKTVYSDKGKTEKIQFVSHVSRDGDSVVTLLAKDHQDAGDLTVIKADGSGTRTVLVKNFIATSPPAISPDKTKLALVSFSNADPHFGFTLSLMNVDGSGKKDIVTDESGISSPVFSPDGKQIAFIKGASASNNAIMLYDLTTSKMQSLYENRDHVIEDFDWSSVGLLSLTAAAGSKQTTNQSEVYIVDPKNKNVVQVTQNTQTEQSPVIAPDASGIGYIQFQEKDILGTSQGDIVVTDADGKRPIIYGKAQQLLGWVK